MAEERGSGAPEARGDSGGPWLERRLRWPDLLIALGIFLLAHRGLMSFYEGLSLSPAGPDMVFWYMSAFGFEIGAPDYFHRVGRPPLLPWIVSLVAEDGFAIGAASLKVTIAAGAALPGLAYLAGVRLFGRLPAFVPVLWLAGLYDLWQIALWFNGQILLNALLPLEMGLGYWALRHPRAWPQLLVGIALGTMLLSREQGLPYIPLALAFALFPWMAPRGAGWRRLALGALLLLIGVALPLVAMKLAVPAPEGLASKGGLPIQDLLIFLSGKVPEVARVQVWAPDYGLDWITQGMARGSHIGWRARVFEAMARRSWYMFAPYHALLGLSLLGLIPLALPGSRALRRPALWCLAHVLPGLAGIVTFGYPYHLSFVVPPLALLSAVGPAALLSQLRLALRDRPLPLRLGVSFAYVGGLAAALFLLTPHVWGQGLSRAGLLERVRRDIRPGYGEAAAWLRANTARTAAVSSGQQLVHLLAGRQMMVHDGIPIPHPDCTLQYGPSREYYLVLDDVEADTFWRRMGTPGEAPPAHFEAVARFPLKGLDRGITIYRIWTDRWDERIEEAERLGETPGFARYCAER